MSECQIKFGMMLTQALRQAENDGEIQLQNLELNAGQAAELLVNSAHGLKQAAAKSEDYCSLLQQLIKVFEKAMLV